ncbi:MAG: transcription antitermination factor NusB [Chitinophagales bacterium]|nr:transcription antitermination factor NusB [Chitinophagales bacterium]
MLGRRSLRVKTMQVLYGYELNKESELSSLELQLIRNMDKTVTMYLLYIAYLNEVCQYSLVDTALKMAKYIQTDEDKKANTNLAAHPLFIKLNESNEWRTLLSSEKIHSYIDKEVVRSLFLVLRDKPKYKEFCAIEQPTQKQFNDILIYMLKKVFSDNENLEGILEEKFNNHDDDAFLLLHLLQKYIDGLKEDMDISVFIQSIRTWQEEQRFARELLKLYYKHDAELQKIIEPNLKNWDMDRIAVLDMVLMKMAICELLYLPNVPVKVSINEYIDISKIYSTPKSKDFVNGILDKVKFQLIAQDLIKKQGRGLME